MKQLGRKPLCPDEFSPGPVIFTAMLFLSLHFKRAFSRWTWVSRCLLKQRKWWWQLDYWSYKSCKAPVKSSPPTNHHPGFLQADALPVAKPTVSKHWRENITFPGLIYPKLTWGLPTLSLTTNSSWLPWERFAMPLISPLMPVPRQPCYLFNHFPVLHVSLQRT